MANELTYLYQIKASDDEMTVSRAVSFLEKEAVPRSFKEVVGKYRDPESAKKHIIEGLVRNHPELAEDSVRKSVGDWFRGKNTVRRPRAIELAFILGLSYEQADEFVALLTEERLHWRSPEEIIDIFALRKGMSYLEALSLKEEARRLFSSDGNDIDQSSRSFTAMIKDDVSRLRTKEELLRYIADSRERFGRFHNNAYQLFVERLNALEKPEPSYFDAESTELTIREILCEYMFENNVRYAKLIAKKTREKKLTPDEGLVLSTVQKSVLSNWPDETTISKMKSRKTDVTRKVLILLLMATEQGFDGGMTEDDEWLDDAEPPTREEVFEDIYERLNQTLYDCGFSSLDPRIPFDWMILYSICVQDIFDTDVRMRGLFRKMFGAAPSEDGN